MKIFKCERCSIDIEMPDDYERPMCCDGYMCGCMGQPIEPLLCTECEEAVFGRGEPIFNPNESTCIMPFDDV